jgi:hypothetical protein
LGALSSFLNHPPTPARRILLAGGVAVFSVCGAGPRSAGAFELQLEAKTKQDQTSTQSSFKGQARDSMAWLSVKLEGGVWDLNPAGMGSLMSSDWVKSDPFRMDLNEVPLVKSTLADTRLTVGLWDDWVRWTSRQAASNYVTPGTEPGYLVRPGFGSDDVATSQHIDAGIWKTDSMRLSVFAEYDRVGAYFEAPIFAIKPQDPFATPNSTTTRLGSAVAWGPITFTLEQRAQQSLAEYNAPTKVENQVGVSLSLDDLRSRSGWIPQGMSWVVPSSTYLIVGQGRVSAAVNQGVNGDTISDVSAGLSWNVGKFYANVGYWTSNYQSQLYPWKGSGLDGSLGFYDGRWGLDLYFDVYRSSYGYMQQLADVLVAQQLITQKYNEIDGGFRFTAHF